jgi:hypothetical protein
VHEQHLILVVLNDAAQLGSAPKKVALRELALEHGVLKVIAESPHRLKDFAKTLIVGDVVTNQVGLAHGYS